jgi:ribokinase
MVSTKSVLVIGSVNQDITVRVQRFPLPGETVLGTDVTYGLGGKGVNQALAAACTGVSTSLMACVGDDRAGRQLVEWLEQRGVDTSAVATVALPTGTTTI